jgi:Cap4 SAVED domain
MATSEIDALKKLLPDSPALAAALEQLARRKPGGLDSYTFSVEQEVPLDNTKTRAHCYFVQMDGNGLPRTADFIRRIYEHVIDYAIPRSEIAEASTEFSNSGSSHKWVRLTQEAKSLFVDLATTGEGGELILFVFAEYIFSLPQIICKMSLKTSDQMHYHGADGVHASVDPESGLLSLYWGEAKMHKTPKGAITACLESLAPFLREGVTGAPERDLKLLRSYIDLNDTELENEFKAYLDPDNLAFNRLRYCGLAFVGFNSSEYPADDQRAVADELANVVRTAFASWRSHIGERIVAEKLFEFEIHFVCMPFHSVDEFRHRFLSELGLGNA